MDTKETDKFMTRAKGTVTITAALKDNESLKGQVTFDVADNIKDVFIRIEGYDHTILKRTEIKVPLYNISSDLGKASGSSGTTSAGWDTTKFNNPTNAHAVVYALKNLCNMHQINKNNGEKDSQDTFDFQDYGWSLYIAMIGRDREINHGWMSGWMYRVNDDLPSVGCQGRDLKDGDDIVWYYGAFGFNNIYTKISADKDEAKAGEKIKVHLKGYEGGYDKQEINVGDASILVTTGSAIDGTWEEYKENDKTVTTDQNGDAYLTFNTPGKYEISAVRYEEGNGKAKGIQQIDIIRPVPLNVEVKDEICPSILVTGIQDNEVTTNGAVTFKVSVTDDTDKNITPSVKLNGDTITGTSGEYKVTLKDGKNTIIIEAADAAGNKSDATYNLIYQSLRMRVNEAVEGACAVANSNHNSGDWVAVGLARAGKADMISQDYIKDDEDYIKDPESESTFIRKPTEFERMTLGILAAGGDPTNIGGYNLIKQIYTSNLKSQGINALVFGLIALDAGEYYVPSDAKWTREKLIKAILDYECTNSKNSYGKKGGWAFGSTSADPDMTGMAMTALAPYNNDKYPDVKAAVERAVEWLSYSQKDDGGYASWGTANSESCDQVVMGLCACGIDPTGDKFTKNSHNIIDGILNFEVPDHGGFGHANNELNGMANEQALYALDQYIYFVDGKGSIYHWGKQASSNKTVNIRIEGKNDVILPSTSVAVNSVNDISIKDVLKQVLDDKKISYKESSNAFTQIGNDTADASANEKWMCSVENGNVIKDLSSRYVNNYENIIVYLGTNTDNSYYTWLFYKKSISNLSQTEAFTGSDVSLTAYGVKVNNPNAGDYKDEPQNIADAKVYVNGEEYKKDDKQVLTGSTGKFTVTFDKAGTYEITIKKDGIRTACFTVVAKDDTEAPTVSFSCQITEPSDYIKEDNTIDKFFISPLDNKDEGTDVSMTVKLNGIDITKDSKEPRWDGAREFDNEKFDKHNNILEVTVTDKAGNTQTITQFVINNRISDTTKPVIIITGITNGEETNDSSVTFKVSVTDDTDENIVPAVKLNGNIITGTNGEYKAVLNEGQNTITIEAVDASGNKSDVTYKLNYIKSVTPTPTPTPTPSSKEISVYIRVEGYGKTVVPREKITVSLFDLNPYLGLASGSSATKSSGWGTDKFKGPTNAHAIVQVLNAHGIDYDFQDYGWSLYIAMIDGDREFDQGSMSGWMYSVNGVLPAVGSQAKLLKDGDEILWFYGAYGFDTLMTSLSASKTSVKTGDEVTLNLSGVGTTDKYEQEKVTVGNATILVNGSEYTVDGKTVTTDDNGKAVIKFDKAGTYEISAVRYKNGYIDIVKPVSVTIHVTGSDISGGTGTGSTGGSGGSGSSGGSSNTTDNSANNKNLDELKQKLQQISISSDQLVSSRQNNTDVVTINENAISSKVNEVNNAIKEIESANGGKKLEGDVKVIPVKINEDSSVNTVLKLQSSVIKCLNDNGFGLNVFFKDSDIKIPKEIVAKMSTDYTYEIVKNSVKSDELNKAKSSLTLQNKLISDACGISLNKAAKDGKEEQMELKGTSVSIKVSAEDVKKISKSSLKLCIYDKTSKKWTIVNARYDDKNGMVTADIK